MGYGVPGKPFLILNVVVVVDYTSNSYVKLPLVVNHRME